ncbi:MAG: RluA family pseudouridine synthase [Planctomycetes bacterium]|nr:RluA family pseudouridine synthase [Planctomycetota bacterium]
MARKSAIEAYEEHGRSDDDEFGEFEPDVAAPRRPAEVEILLDDPRFVVVAKPAGIPTIPERFRKDAPTIVDAVERLLRRRDPAAPRPLVCHRLDKDTSGVLILAKDQEAATDLMGQFEAREVAKSYVALTMGAPQPPAGSVEFRIDDDPRRKGAMVLVSKGGRDCSSEYETLEVWRGISLVRVRPKTGRTHQVRLTLQHLGTPCAIDALYGSAEPLKLSAWKTGYRLAKRTVESPLIDRLTLHAESIEFRRPGSVEDNAAADTSARVRVEAPLPRDMATTIRQLRRWGAPGTL